MNENKPQDDKLGNKQGPGNQQGQRPEDRESQGQQKGSQQIPSQPQRDTDVTRK